MDRRHILLGILLSMLILVLAGCSTGEPSPKEEHNVYIVQTSPANMLEQLKHGEIDGFVAWEPFNATAVDQGFGRYLIKSAEPWPDHPCCLFAVSNGVADQRLLEALAWVHVKANMFINNDDNRETIIEYAAEFTGQSAAVVIEALSNVNFVDEVNEEGLRQFHEALKSNQLITMDYQDLGFDDEQHFWQDFLLAETIATVKEKMAAIPDWVPEPVEEGYLLRMGYITQDLHQLAAYVGVKEGYFEAVGLVPEQNLSQNSYANGVAIMQAFANNEIDVAYLGGAPAVLKRINDNIPIVLIGGANNEGSGLVVSSDSSVAQIEDLAGKTIAVPGIGTVQYTLLQMLTDEHGLNLVVK